MKSLTIENLFQHHCRVIRKRPYDMKHGDVVDGSRVRWMQSVVVTAVSSPEMNQRQHPPLCDATHPRICATTRYYVDEMHVRMIMRDEKQQNTNQTNTQTNVGKNEADNKHRNTTATGWQHVAMRLVDFICAESLDTAVACFTMPGLKHSRWVRACVRACRYRFTFSRFFVATHVGRHCQRR